MKMTNVYHRFGKRVVDFLFSLILLVTLIPLFLLIILLLFIINRGEIFFVQKRSGKHGKFFDIIKFKTMSDELNEKNELLADIDRITPVGRILRKFSIDELPQLVNVLRGDMSIVGPRPLPIEYDSLYSMAQRKRFITTPGITGYAQVNGRNSLTWDEKFNMDSWYVDNISFALDLKIIFLTIPVVLSKTGVNSSKLETMTTLAKWKKRE